MTEEKASGNNATGRGDPREVEIDPWVVVIVVVVVIGASEK